MNKWTKIPSREGVFISTFRHDGFFYLMDLQAHIRFKQLNLQDFVAGQIF